MRKFFKSTLILAAGALLAASCANKESFVAETEREGGDGTLDGKAVTVYFGPQTKDEIQTTDEKRLNVVDLYVFDASGHLVAKEHTTESSVTVYLRKAAMTFKVIANGPAAAANLSTVAEVDAYHVPFASNTTSSFFMKGSKTQTITASTSSLSVDLYRDAARVDLTAAPVFSGSAAGATYQGAFLINVPKNYSTSATVSAAADAWNFRNTVATAPEQTSLLSISASGSYPKTVYGYPNATAEAADESTEDYVTKLVIKASLFGETHWYPVGIPNMQSNKIYRVSNINIKSGGSDNPNEYVTQQSLSVELNVVDWEEGTNEGSYNDALIPPHVYTFAGLEIAPANMYYDGTKFCVADSWRNTSYADKYGLVAGSYYFAWEDLASFHSDPQEIEHECYIEIDNQGTLVSYRGHSDWRLPTGGEWEDILTDDASVRPGSTVNGYTNKHFIWLPFVPDYGITNWPDGNDWFELVIVFPDNENITLPFAIDDDDEYVENYIFDYDGGGCTEEDVTAAMLDALVSQGCVILPGYCSRDIEYDDWKTPSNGSTSYYATSEDNGISFFGNDMLNSGYCETHQNALIRLVRDAN